MSTADERERACEHFMLMRVGYLKLVEREPVRIWSLFDGDGETVHIGDLATLYWLAMNSAIPLMTVH